MFFSCLINQIMVKYLVNKFKQFFNYISGIFYNLYLFFFDREKYTYIEMYNAYMAMYDYLLKDYSKEDLDKVSISKERFIEIAKFLKHDVINRGPALLVMFTALNNIVHIFDDKKNSDDRYAIFNMIAGLLKDFQNQVQEGVYDQESNNFFLERFLVTKDYHLINPKKMFRAFTSLASAIYRGGIYSKINWSKVDIVVDNTDKKVYFTFNPGCLAKLTEIQGGFMYQSHLEEIKTVLGQIENFFKFMPKYKSYEIEWHDNYLKFFNHQDKMEEESKKHWEKYMDQLEDHLDSDPIVRVIDVCTEIIPSEDYTEAIVKIHEHLHNVEEALYELTHSEYFAKSTADIDENIYIELKNKYISAYNELHSSMEVLTKECNIELQTKHYRALASAYREFCVKGLVTFINVFDHDFESLLTGPTYKYTDDLIKCFKHFSTAYNYMSLPFLMDDDVDISNEERLLFNPLNRGKRAFYNNMTTGDEVSLTNMLLGLLSGFIDDENTPKISNLYSSWKTTNKYK